MEISPSVEARRSRAESRVLFPEPVRPSSPICTHVYIHTCVHKCKEDFSISIFHFLPTAAITPDSLNVTHALPAVHREGDVAEDGASCLRVLDRQALDVHLAVAGPEVLGVRVVDDQVRMALPA